jgi:hypothetical protein
MRALYVGLNCDGDLRYITKQGIELYKTTDCVHHHIFRLLVLMLCNQPDLADIGISVGKSTAVSQYDIDCVISSRSSAKDHKSD